MGSCSFCASQVPDAADSCPSCLCPLAGAAEAAMPLSTVMDALPFLFEDDRWILPRHDGLDWFVRGSVTTLSFALVPGGSALKMKVSSMVARTGGYAAASALAARLRRSVPLGVFVASEDTVSCRISLTLAVSDGGLLRLAAASLLLVTDAAAAARHLLSTLPPSPSLAVASVPHPEHGWPDDDGSLFLRFFGADDGSWLRGRWPRVLSGLTAILSDRGFVLEGRGAFRIPLSTSPELLLRPPSLLPLLPAHYGLRADLRLAPESLRLTAVGPSELNAVDLLLLDRMPVSMLSSISASGAPNPGLACSLWLPSSVLGPPETPDARLSEVLADVVMHLSAGPLSWVEDAASGR